MHNKIDVPKKSKRLIIWNGGSSWHLLNTPKLTGYSSLAAGKEIKS